GRRAGGRGGREGAHRGGRGRRREGRPLPGRARPRARREPRPAGVEPVTRAPSGGAGAYPERQEDPRTGAEHARPVQLDVEFVEPRSRLTTFFRWILAIPHLIFASLWGIVASIVVLIAWFAILFTGRFPAGMYNLVDGWVRYYSRVFGYMYLVSD